MTRITGLATGMDIDSIIESQMQVYKNKVDTEKQKKEILEIKQKLYRDVLNDANTFYNKYLDITKETSILKSTNFSSVSFESTDKSVASAKNLTSNSLDSYKINVKNLAMPARTTLSMKDVVGEGTLRINYVDAKGDDLVIDVDISKCSTDVELAKTLNTALKDKGLKATYSDFTKGVVVETTATGSLRASKTNVFTIESGSKNGDDFIANNNIKKESSKGSDLEATITKTNTVPQETITYDASNVLGNNKVVVDGVEFTFSSVGETSISSSRDVSKTKEKLVNFVNDYNTLMEKLNTLVNDKHDRGYSPLTDAQKKEMSEEEIKLWNEKVQKGQLSRDSDISRIINSLKSATKDAVSGSSLYLEKIGIKPVSDYAGNKNGTFTIEEGTLEKALEEDMDGVLELFIGVPSNSDALTDREKYNAKGIFQRVKDILYSETVSSGSAISKKAGLQNSSTFTNNELTKSIKTFESKISKMERDLTLKEQALYSKWAAVETAMNKFNSQQSYLTSQFS